MYLPFPKYFPIKTLYFNLIRIDIAPYNLDKKIEIKREIKVIIFSK